MARKPGDGSGGGRRKRPSARQPGRGRGQRSSAPAPKRTRTGQPIRQRDSGDGRRRGDVDPREELQRLAGPTAERAYGRLMEAADAYAADRYRDAKRLLEALRDRHPAAMSVRELLGLTYYRMGRFDDALKELVPYVEATGTLDQHPVLMDCHRARKDWDEVESLWDDLRRVSPSGDVVTEGRIVMAGSLADRGRLADAIRLLDKGPVDPKVPRDHHLRLWYALADLEERAGNLPRARQLFDRIRRREADFADVAQRLAALG